MLITTPHDILTIDGLSGIQTKDIFNRFHQILLLLRHGNGHTQHFLYRLVIGIFPVDSMQ